MRSEFFRLRKSGFIASGRIALLGAVAFLAGCAAAGPAPGRSDAFNARIESMVTAVHCVASGLGALSSPPGLVDSIRRFIAPVRFFRDGSGYFFVYDTDGVVIAHAVDPDLVGKNLFSIRDKTGKYFVREKIAAARAGGGFVDYYWPEPKTKEVKKKRVYVEMIPGTNYLIGSGVYFE